MWRWCVVHNGYNNTIIITIKNVGRLLYNTYGNETTPTTENADFNKQKYNNNILIDSRRQVRSHTTRANRGAR